MAHSRAGGIGRKCIACSRPAVPGRSRCEPCLESIRKARQRYVDRNRIAVREGQRRSREKRIADGRCGCGAELVDGAARCPACLADQRNATIAKREKRAAAGQCRQCGAPACGKSHCAACLDRIAARNRDLRLEVLAAYGDRCECCGETEPMFLQIDHIEDDGSADRAAGLQSTRLYRSLKRRGFPKDRYRLLCANCNLGRYLNGGVCPHHNHQTKDTLP
jgi:hypothetical protein